MVTPRTKLYVQLQPGPDGLEMLREVQVTLEADSETRLVTTGAAHITVLHIGLVERMATTIARGSREPVDVVVARAEDLACQLEAVVAATPWRHLTLQPNGFDRFGGRGSSYVITFASTPELDELHRQSLEVLTRFFTACGIKEVASFMAGDANFCHALSLRPHLTVAKAYYGHEAEVALRQITFELMPVRY